LATDLVLLAISFIIIILGAELFTNGVEWLGVRLRLSEGAVGSVLAAVGTALPETLIPFVALVLFKEQSSHDVGLGAILGAPFMLATLGFFVTAMAAVAYRSRRPSGWRLTVDPVILRRDLGFFVPLYAAAIGVSFTPVGFWGRYAVAGALVLCYAVYVYINLRESAEGEKNEPLMFNLVWAYFPLASRQPDRAAHAQRRELLDARRPRIRACIGQIALALGMIVGGAYQFVHATQQITMMIGFSPLVFALVVAPIATELPEKFNSVIWVRQGKDTLSLGNISGAMVFQATFPVSIGILLTNWRFERGIVGGAALLSAGIALVSAVTVLVAARGKRGETMSPWTLALGLPWWLLFAVYVVTTQIRAAGGG
jgi:cation:H+ antiporter